MWQVMKKKNRLPYFSSFIKKMDIIYEKNIDEIKIIDFNTNTTHEKNIDEIKIIDFNTKTTISQGDIITNKKNSRKTIFSFFPSFYQ